MRAVTRSNYDFTRVGRFISQSTSQHEKPIMPKDNFSREERYIPFCEITENKIFHMINYIHINYAINIIVDSIVA